MITIVQTLAGATDFDGTAGQGLVEFLDLPLSNDPNIVPIVTSISLDNDAAETIGVNCFIKPSAAALTTTVRKVVRRPAAAINGFNVDGCKIYVPRLVLGNTTLVPWVLVLITSGKAVPASLVVSYTTGPIPGGGAF